MTRMLFDSFNNRLRKKQSVEEAYKEIFEGTPPIIIHTYVSHWFVKLFRYDVLLGITFNVSNDQTTDYHRRLIKDNN